MKKEEVKETEKLKTEATEAAGIEASQEVAEAEEPIEKSAPAKETAGNENVAAEALAEDKEEKTAKAGKRSAKSLKEAEVKEAKEERKAAKAEAEEAGDKPKQKASPTRSRLERQGKKFQEAAKLVQKDKQYTLKEALELAVKTNPAKFDASVELHVNLGVDPRHADQNIRDNLVLPAGTGKKVRVAVFADVDDAAAAKQAGADIAGIEDLLKDLEKGAINFDILIATPSQMPKLGKFARTLGPRGLMPNPKSGTVTNDVAKAVQEAKAGRVEYRVDSTGIVHVAVGKVSFGAAKLEENVRAVLASVKAAKPASVKSGYIKAVHLATSMGPSIAVATSEV